MVASVRRALLGLPVLVLVILGVFGSPTLATCGGHDEVVTAALRACPRATALLGDDAHPARLGMACGSTETSGGSGRASWDMPYTGARARGSVSFDAEKRGGAWILHRAVLEAGGETIDLLACSGARPDVRGGRLAQTNADAAEATFDGKVIRSSHPILAAGSTCTGTLRRERGATTARVTVRCVGPESEIALYDGRGAFKLDVGDPSRRDDDRSEYEDPQTSEQDATPGCRLSSAGASGTLTIWDTSPAYELVVAL
jgi:hypothetical protein